MNHPLKTSSTLVIATGVFLAGWAAFAQPQDKSKDKAAPAKKAADVKETEEEAIRRTAVAFTTAYNKHDAKAVSEQFTPKAEFTDEDGNLIKGREAIQQDFAAMFAKYPECKIEVEVASIRILTPNVAIEEGIVRGHPVPNEAANVSSYVAIDVKVDGRWLTASVSDFEADAQALSPNDHLQELAWMVGDWLDEGPESTVKSTCRWDASGNYLLHDFFLRIVGRDSISGSMRIGWDPLTQQLKSWTFNTDSGYSEGLWIRIGDEWLVKSRGVNAAGEAVSAASVYRLIDNDTMTWRASDRVVGGKPQDDVPENVIKRHTSPPKID